jgi:hypothetical protein
MKLLTLALAILTALVPAALHPDLVPAAAGAQHEQHGRPAPPGAQQPAERLGQVSFQVSCGPAVEPSFDRALALLHSFWYLEAHRAFTAIATAHPGCAMAHWGVAMSLWYQIWSPPSPANLRRGWEAVERATAAAASATPRERGFIAAAEAFFRDADRLDHRTRAAAYADAMAQLYRSFPDDPEVALFHALALQATADPHDKTYSKQRASGAIAEKIFAARPEHPGAAHYLIHAYDYPALAHQARGAADRYARFAPTVPHALHMPSHIYVLLGRWPETIEGNLVAAEAERTRGNPDDHMHALDYLVYAYLQRAQDDEALRVLGDGRKIVADLAARKVDSGRHTAPFAIAAMEARYAMERGRWAEAAALEPRPTRFPYTDSMIHFARAVGAARTGNATQARADVDRLAALAGTLRQANNPYWAEQVEIQRRAAAAWLARAEGKPDEALALARSAAELEESTEKHNITPGPIASGRELLADLLLDLGRPADAAREYQASLQRAPARFKTLHGIARASELAGDRATAEVHYQRLLALAAPAAAARPELAQARAFLGR